MDELNKDWSQDPGFQQAVAEVLQKRLTAQALEIAEYFPKHWPDWKLIPEQRVLRSYFEDMSNPAYPIREMIDIDIQLGETPQDLERIMLMRQNKILRDHIHALLREVTR